MRILDIVVGFVINIIAGIALFFLLPPFGNQRDKWLILTIIILGSGLLTLLTLLMLNHLRLSGIGVHKVLKSATVGKGNAGVILQKVNENFAFMGIAANKWIRTGPTLIDTAKRLGFCNGAMRFLLLDPYSDEAKRISKIQHGDPEFSARLIRESLRHFKTLKESGYKVEVRLYSFTPIFRIAIVDNNLLYLGFYRGGTEGQDSPQMLLRRYSKKSYFQPFQSYYEDMWEKSAEPDWKTI